ncbi:hypothetical protein HZH66_011095 [Vespula vulgaris]|uniref:Uncharacterized protein n=1 Tax=Vespula vulgaris TaxID=7454 RepID=A0A834MXF8_VESVU|nr:hypothetical protein HZH66_011095 [Vespula vulgaris]
MRLSTSSAAPFEPVLRRAKDFEAIAGCWASYPQINRVSALRLGLGRDAEASVRVVWLSGNCDCRGNEEI